MTAGYNQLLTLWRSNKTYDEIAQDLKIDRKTVVDTFRGMREKGLIPSGDRPRSKANNRGNDGRAYHVTDDGGLLAALHKEHPERAPKK